MQKHVYTLFFV
jgi:hypothetical protein